MDKKDKSKDETTLTPALEESTSASGMNFGQKNFCKEETGVTIEVEGLTDPGASTPEAPPATAPRASAAKPAVPQPVGKGAFEHPPLSSASSSSSKSSLRQKMSSASVAAPSRGTPFLSPAVVVIGLVAAGYYFYQRSNKPVIIRPSVPHPSVTAKFAPEEPAALAVVNLNKPVYGDRIEEESAVFALKSDADDFTVLVNGKDMPVISGKITLPLYQNLDIRFTRRGYKEIQMNEEIKKSETRTVVLKFEKDPNPPPPKRLYN